MNKATLALPVVILLFTSHSHAQLNVQAGTRVVIDKGGYVVATGNVTSTVSISGGGTFLLKGTSQQRLDMTGVNITNLSIDNPANIVLVKAARIGATLKFVQGKILPGDNSLYLSDTAVVSGAGPGKFIETNGTGQVRKNLTKNVTFYLMPVGYGTQYTPVVISTTGTYAAANVGVYCKGTADPNKPTSVSNYLNTYWGVTRTGVNGSVSAVATYNAANIVGTESLMKGYLRTGTTWLTTGVSLNTSTNQITANITGTGLAIYAMSTPPAVRSTSRLDENISLPHEMVYPNPAGAWTNLMIHNTMPEKASIFISDYAGRIISRHTIELVEGSQQYRVNISTMKPGAYTVRVISKTSARNFWLIKL